MAEQTAQIGFAYTEFRGGAGKGYGLPELKRKPIEDRPYFRVHRKPRCLPGKGGSTAAEGNETLGKQRLRKKNIAALFTVKFLRGPG